MAEKDNLDLYDMAFDDDAMNEHVRRAIDERDRLMKVEMKASQKNATKRKWKERILLIAAICTVLTFLGWLLEKIGVF